MPDEDLTLCELAWRVYLAEPFARTFEKDVGLEGHDPFPRSFRARGHLGSSSFLDPGLAPWAESGGPLGREVEAVLAHPRIRDRIFLL